MPGDWKDTGVTGSISTYDDITELGRNAYELLTKTRQTLTFTSTVYSEKRSVLRKCPGKEFLLLRHRDIPVI